MRKQLKAEVIRARCDSDLKNDIEQIARFQRLDEADIIRIACSMYVQKFKTPNNNQIGGLQLAS